MPSSKIKNKFLITLILIIVLILFLNFFDKEVKNFFYLLSTPIQKSFWEAGIIFSNFLETVFEKQNLKKENENLRLRIEELIAENVRLKELKKENEILRQGLNLGLQKEFQLKIAQVIEKDINRDYLKINLGLRDDLRVGLPVITQQKVLVGKISEVYSNFSKIKLISDQESSFDAKISDTEIYGLLKGQGNFKVYLDRLPREKEIKKGEQVMTSALGGIFPPDIFIGEIEEVEKSDIEPFQKAEIKPAFNLQDLNYIFIITNF